MAALLRHAPRGLLLLPLILVTLFGVAAATAPDADAQTRRAATADDDLEALMKRFEERLQEMREEFRVELEKARAEGGGGDLRRARERIQQLEDENARLRRAVREMRAQLDEMSATDETGREERPRGMLGVTLTGTPPELAEALKVNPSNTVMVTGVQPESPAARMGLRANDVITAFDDQKGDLEVFIAHMGTKRAGDEVVLTYARRQQSGDILRITGRTELMAWREPTAPAGGTPAIRIEPAPPPPVEPTAPVGPITLGVTVDEADGGLVVTSVTDGSNAAIAGLQEGDRIRRFGDRRTRTIDALREAIQASRSGQEVTIRFARGDRTWESVVRLSDRSGGARKISGPTEVGGGTSSGNDRAPGFLGVAVDEGSGGLVVAEVVDGSAAATMGLETGDRLISVNSERVRTIDELGRVLSGLRVGDRATLAIRRNGTRMDLSGTLGPRPGGEEQGRATPAAAAAVATASARQQPSEAVPEGERGRLGLTAVERDGGVVIDALAPGSAAAAAGARAGDRIAEIEGRPVDGIPTIADVLSRHRPGDRLALVLGRDGRTITVTVTLGGAEETAAAPAVAAPRTPPRLGVEVEERPDGLWVIAVESDGAAGLAGVAVGDRIVRCGAHPVTDLPSMRRAVRALDASLATELAVRRGDREHRLEVVPIAE